MDLHSLRAGFLDELNKIAQIELRGLSNEAVMGAQAPPEISSPGFAKAKSILDLADQIQEEIKTSAAEPESGLDRAKKTLGYSLAGAGVGKAIGKIHSTIPSVYRSMNNPALSAAERFHAGSRVNHIEHGLLVGGALTGAALGAYRDHKKKKAKTAAASPAMALKATQQVGSIKNSIHTGPSIRRQVSAQLIGRKGI